MSFCPCDLVLCWLLAAGCRRHDRKDRKAAAAPPCRQLAGLPAQMGVGRLACACKAFAHARACACCNCRDWCLWGSGAEHSTSCFFLARTKTGRASLTHSRRPDIPDCQGLSGKSCPQEPAFRVSKQYRTPRDEGFGSSTLKGAPRPSFWESTGAEHPPGWRPPPAAQTPPLCREAGLWGNTAGQAHQHPCPCTKRTRARFDTGMQLGNVGPAVAGRPHQPPSCTGQS